MTGGIGVDLPQDVADAQDGSRIATYAREAEQAGFDGLWVTDSAAPGVLSPLATLAFAAAVTTRPRLGVAVLVSALQSPLRLARNLATIDRLSGGRLDIGVGIGKDGGSYARHGVHVDRRVTHFENNVTLLRRLLREDTVSSDGPWWPMENQPRPVEPLQLPTPPIWIGARRAGALERAVRLGDGWIGAGSMSLHDFEAALGEVEDHVRHAGRDRASFQVAKRVYVHVGTVTDTTRSALGAWFQGHYGNAALAEQVAVAGPAGDVVAHLGHLRDLGVGTLVLHPVVDAREQMLHLARDVVPEVPPVTMPR